MDRVHIGNNSIKSEMNAFHFQLSTRHPVSQALFPLAHVNKFATPSFMALVTAYPPPVSRGRAKSPACLCSSNLIIAKIQIFGMIRNPKEGIVPFMGQVYHHQLQP